MKTINFILHCYIFLFVFSLSLPVFYHSAFFVGFASLIHLLMVKRIKFKKISLYEFNYIFISIFGYFFVFVVAQFFGTLDLSFLKTYTNCFLSAICAIPLSKLISHYTKNGVEFIARSFFISFAVQSFIIISVFFLPDLKPIVNYFHRNAELSAELDVFSNGLRTNALSGGLFFGLALSFGVGVVISLHNFLIIEKCMPSLKKIILFFVINVGLVFTGRFGFIYLICIVFYVLVINKRILFRVGIKCGVIFLLLVCAIVYLYYSVSDFASVYDNVIHPYAFEMLDSYMNDRGFHSQSTGRLEDMYNINVTVEQLVFGTGLYTGVDGEYYMHTDVGYLRHLLFGGVAFLLFALFHFCYLLSPMFKVSGYRVLGLSLLLLALISSFKGEVLLTMVSVITPIFLYSLTLNNERVRGRMECGYAR